MHYKLDQKDKDILELLQVNSKITVKELALKVNLSTTPVFERIKRLEKEGIIRGYMAHLDKEKLGYDLTVFCQVSLKTHTEKLIHDFEQAIKNMPEVVEAYHIAGNFDYLLKVIAHNNKQYHQFIIETLSKLDMISTLQSNFVMFETKKRSAYNVKLIE